MTISQHQPRFLLRMGIAAGFVLALVLALLPGPQTGRSLAAPASGGTCVTLQPNASAGKDAYIDAHNANSNNGGGSQLKVKTESTSKLKRTLLQFDLSAIPSTATVNSATLSLWVEDVRDGNVTINAHGVTSAWTESEVTWNDRAASTAWTTAGGDYGSTVDSTTFTKDVKHYWATWSLTSLAVSWVASPAANFGVLLESPVTSPKNETKFTSSDGGTASHHPKLEVCYSEILSISPDHSGAKLPGQTQTYTHTVSVGNLTDVVQLSASSSQSWTTRIYSDANGNGQVDGSDAPITQTPSMGPNATYPIQVQVDVPGGAAQGTVDVTTITASGQSSGKSDTATDTTQVGNPPVVDGRLDGSYTFIKRTNPGADAPGNLYRYDGASTCYYAFVVDRSFNDNVYADSDAAYMALDGWTSNNHAFSKLRDSDKAWFNISYSGGSYSNLTLDYLRDLGSGTWDSGQTGGDGSAAPGTPPIDAAMTSLHWNLLNSGWSDLTHSPAYNYNDTLSHYWEWAMIYEFSIPKSQMNGECGTVDLAGAHNSPSKNNASLGQIGDYIWKDLDGQGDQDENDAGLPNVTVNLKQGGAVMRTTQTEPGTSGFYLFNNLSAGTYVVDVDESTLPAGYTLTTANEPLTVNLSSGQVYTTADFGYNAGATIGDYVWLDANENGIQDGGETGVPGVTVKLLDSGGSEINATTTNSSGLYTFTVQAGTYEVKFVLPLAYHFAPQNQGSDDAKDSDANTSTGKTGTFSVGANQHKDDVDAGLVRNPDVCYAVADGTTSSNDSSALDTLALLDRLTGATTAVGSGVGNTGTYNVEAIAFQPGGTVLYAADADQLGALDLVTGAFTATSAKFGTGNGSAGSKTFSDVDGLTFDPATGILYGTHRRSGNDLLFQIDPATGAHVPNAFGSGVDYVEVSPVAGLEDVDDIAVDPVTGVMYATVNSGSSSDDHLVIVNKSTGATTDVGIIKLADNTKIQDIEGLAFFNDGKLYGSSGKNGPTTNALYRIDKGSAVATYVGAFTEPLRDFEGLACLTASSTVVVDKSVQSTEITQGGQVTFTIRITNTGTADIDVLPLKDMYDASKLQFVSATPTQSNVSGGVVAWNDLTAAGPNGFAQNLAPNQAFQITVHFQATTATRSGLRRILDSLSARSSSDTDNVCDDDFDNDGIDNNADNDDDNDGIPDSIDPDDDNDGIPDSSDPDDDNDGIPDDKDDDHCLCSSDFDNDGVPDSVDTDDDGDGIPDISDPDDDNDGIPDDVDNDDDNDGIPDSSDNGACSVPSAAIGDRVYYDINGDGGQDDDGEPGLNGVTVNLYQSVCPGSGAPFKSMLTSGDGSYAFTGLAAGTYCVNVDENTLPSGVSLTTGNEPLQKTLASDEKYWLADFGYQAQKSGETCDLAGVDGATTASGGAVAPAYDQACVAITAKPDYTISKTLNSISPVRSGESISFTVRITNTGAVTLTTVPLTDTYDQNYITYVSSTPASDDQINDGVINWGDLTQSGAQGLGADLAPGQVFSVVVEFVGRHDTTGLPAQSPCTATGYTCNVATVSGAKYDPDGPGGVGEQGPLPPKQAWDDVQVVVPTAVDVTDAAASAWVNGVTLRWRTTNETNIVGFNVARLGASGRQTLNSDLILAQASGQPTGGVYSFVDGAVLPGASYDYWLQIVHADGEATELSLGAVTGRWYVFMSQVER